MSIKENRKAVPLLNFDLKNPNQEIFATLKKDICISSYPPSSQPIFIWDQTLWFVETSFFGRRY